MAINQEHLNTAWANCNDFKAQLVAVTKTRALPDLKALYQLNIKIFGENKVLELIEKAQSLPKDIQWHFIGHLQRNKVKSLLPWVDTIQSVDSWELLEKINAEAQQINKTINVFLQVHIAEEEHKYGFEKTTFVETLQHYDFKRLTHILVKGIMGMATYTHDESKIEAEFKFLKGLFDEINNRKILSIPFLSMGMSNDYLLALKNGANTVRIGSLLYNA